ncbi:hypothetical protein PVAP13_2NG539400 [Panicum virgatum]|uniref:F-box domain-containing protein n=2 Tax=Panicum virgatum TaxID=38727 RepID=A0A8T0VRF4_PANVG|nr:hypothetical protein PVAP13_2NG539400 [Panicum virgatum]
MASPSCPVRRRIEAKESPLPLLALSDDLLEEIFIRVGSPADLARASTACVAFRRLIADPTFLRRYRSLRSPIFLGVIYQPYRCYQYPRYDFRAVETPHPNADVAQAFGRAAYFSFRYIPPLQRHQWDVCDVRDGRVLLSYCDFGDAGFGNLAVCDPLSREYVLLPAIADGLLASVLLEEIYELEEFEASFIPSRDTEETPLKVMYRARSATKSVVLVFSPDSGHWSIGTCTTWDSLSLNVTPDDKDTFVVRSPPSWAYHCCYWRVYRKNKLLKLDTRRMEFSTIDLPPKNHEDVQRVIVEAEEGKIAMFSYDFGGKSLDYYTFLQNDGEKAYAWHLKNTIPLPTGYKKWEIEDAAAEGYIFLVGTRGHYSPVFSLEIKTFTMEEFDLSIKNPYRSIYPYFGFPPSMSPRRLQGYEAV